jgi:DNA-binding XRE family transcriptional regulator
MASRANPLGIPPRAVAKPCLRDPSLQAVYEALEEESALAHLVIEARTRAQLTQEELADRMGVTPSAIARLENGKAAPSLATLRRIARATGTRLAMSFVPRPASKSGVIPRSH